MTILSPILVTNGAILPLKTEGGGGGLRNDEFHEIFTKSGQLAHRRRAVGGVSGSVQFNEIS